MLSITKLLLIVCSKSSEKNMQSAGVYYGVYQDLVIRQYRQISKNYTQYKHTHTLSTHFMLFISCASIGHTLTKKNLTRLVVSLPAIGSSQLFARIEFSEKNRSGTRASRSYYIDIKTQTCFFVQSFARFSLTFSTVFSIIYSFNQHNTKNSP